MAISAHQRTLCGELEGRERLRRRSLRCLLLDDHSEARRTQLRGEKVELLMADVLTCGEKGAVVSTCMLLGSNSSWLKCSPWRGTAPLTDEGGNQRSSVVISSPWRGSAPLTDCMKARMRRIRSSLSSSSCRRRIQG